MKREKSFPAELGYRWPAEWEPHEATWLAWPHNRETWPGKFEPVPEQFAQVVKTLASVERVHVLAGRPEVMAQAEQMVGRIGNVVLEDIPTNDAWARDHGPMFLVHQQDRSLALVDWQYNAWGNKYPPYDLDNAVPQKVATRYGWRCFAAEMVLEGGSVDGNGQGTVLTTEACLLNPNRNPSLTREHVEQYLERYCGARRVFWLPGEGIAGDDTDGHIDQLARFVSPKVVVCAASDDAHDEQYEPLQNTRAILRTLRDQDGQALDVVPLFMPRPMYFQKQRIPASYCNFYIANQIVLVPQFGDPADERAVKTLAELFPGREMIGLPALDLAWGLGAFHCLTQQQPVAAAG